MGVVWSGQLGSVCSAELGSIYSGQVGSVWLEFPDFDKFNYLQYQAFIMSKKINNNNNTHEKSAQIQPDEKVCYNCKHMVWLVGLGQGIRCSKILINGLAQIVPSRRHSCDLFERVKSQEIKP